MVEKVAVTQGATTTEFTYINYQDWNNPLHKIEVYCAGRLTERKNGAVVRDRRRARPRLATCKSWCLYRERGEGDERYDEGTNHRVGEE